MAMVHGYCIFGGWTIASYLNNRTEQDHRGIKQRYYPMLGLQELRLGITLLSRL
jgi:transposase-like protein